MKTSTLLEVAMEVAMQLGNSPTAMTLPRAGARHWMVDIVNEIENLGIIDDNSEDIDEIITGYLAQRGLV